VIPKKEKVLERARELYAEHCYRTGCPELANVNPEDGELLESGFYSAALSSLMTNTETKNEQWLRESENAETSVFAVDIDALFDSGALILGSKHTGKSDIAMILSDKAMLEKAIVVVFDPSLDWIARSSIPRVMKVEPYRTLDVPCESTIFDISLLSPSQQTRIVENFARLLFEHQAQAETRRQYLVIFEEAHTYFTQGCMRSENLANCVRLLSVGRNVSIACVLISQFASMLDKFAVKHSTSQMWCGFTREPNDIKYLKQILGSEVEKLAKLEDGHFLYLTRNGISKIKIEPHENQNIKTRLVIPQSTPALEQVKPKEQTTVVPFLKFAMLFCFAILLLRAMMR
jgi:hypothetical protein